MNTYYDYKTYGNIEKFSNCPEDNYKPKNDLQNNLKLLNEKNNSRNNFFNNDDGKILNVEYIPRELFSSYMNKNQNYESNNFKNSYLYEKNNEPKYLTEDDNNPKFHQNEFNNISESYNKSDMIFNTNINNNKIENTKSNSNLHLNGNISKETNENQRYNGAHGHPRVRAIMHRAPTTPCPPAATPRHTRA